MVQLPFFPKFTCEWNSFILIPNFDVKFIIDLIYAYKSNYRTELNLNKFDDNFNMRICKNEN